MSVGADEGWGVTPDMGIQGDMHQYARQMSYNAGTALVSVWTAGEDGDPVADLESALFLLDDRPMTHHRIELTVAAAIKPTLRRYIIMLICHGNTDRAKRAIEFAIEKPHMLNEVMP